MPAYDQPVKMLIDGLNKTGHITHTQHRKTMVTMHHNAGRLSHEGVLEVWKTRPASAHFDVDGAGRVAQYAWLNEYAWACGNTKGNQDSISIEMANSAVGGDWPVAEVTWKSAARLAGWIFAKIIGVRPSKDNLVMHSHWKATACAGPYIGRVMPAILELANQSYDYFSGGSAPTQPVAQPPSTGPRSIAAIAQEVLEGKWGNGDDRRVRLTNAGYNYEAVQTEVNRRLGGGAPAAHKKTVDEVAREVIKGLWGNGPIRRQRLEGAGYNYAAVQRRVNELL
jgi:hypothetical protein